MLEADNLRTSLNHLSADLKDKLRISRLDQGTLYFWCAIEGVGFGVSLVNASLLILHQYVDPTATQAADYILPLIGGLVLLYLGRLCKISTFARIRAKLTQKANELMLEAKTDLADALKELLERSALEVAEAESKAHPKN